MFPKLLLTWVAGLAVAGSSGNAQTQAPPPDNRIPESSSASSRLSVTETQWNLVELNGSPVSSRSPGSQPYIYLQTQGDKLSGSGGCNRLFGSFDLSGSSLQFHSVAQTLMACPGNSAERESALLDALKLTTSFQVSGDVLLLRVDDRVLARFQAKKK
ncbi:protein of unknown function DUF306, Meta and HslJ [Acidisarcina polymorpha]|uniref:DUF306 domain-containing protein n=1 Tax=Acidisarcina polymorpha TaxID=2211140 RepID=A0A2Z5G678_9BACT|nr:META domain-containing protein [Acidisarcina polymorpha]AXC14753.1 protein of unknown function DUF306, Meta and HslJ [Acidisarcina polymorpha]